MENIIKVVENKLWEIEDTKDSTRLYMDSSRKWPIMYWVQYGLQEINNHCITIKTKRHICEKRF